MFNNVFIHIWNGKMIKLLSIHIDLIVLDRVELINTWSATEINLIWLIMQSMYLL